MCLSYICIPRVLGICGDCVYLKELSMLFSCFSYVGGYLIKSRYCAGGLIATQAKYSINRRLSILGGFCFISLYGGF